jgi:hypothetical protein
MIANRFGIHIEMHHSLDQKRLEMAKAFAKLTRKARRMAESKSKKRSVKPAKVQTMTVLPPQTKIHDAASQSLDSLQRHQNFPPVSNQTCAYAEEKRSVVDPANFNSSALMCARWPADDQSQSRMPPNIFSSIPVMPFVHTPYSFCSLPPPPGPYTSFSTAFLLGAAWAKTAATPLASYASYASFRPFLE